MAQDEIIGSLGVQITADASELQSAIDDAITAATAGASAIQDAFSNTDAFTGMVSAIDNVSESIYEMGDAAASVSSGIADAAQAATSLGDAATSTDTAIAGVGTAASEATGSVQEFTQAESEAGSAGEEAGSGLSIFRGSLLELAEGLAVTEGIKELATEALDVYSSVQQATVSLTALTGSASAANEMIAGLEETAQQIPVATESLISAAQRMTAFGLSSEQVTTALNDAANASFATGASFDSAAQRLTMMAAAGTAGARQLVSLGLTADQVAEAMNQMGVTSDATASTLAKDFKALDVDTRLEVINTALGKFDGIATASADTVGGAWQILGNKWEEVTKQMGADLAPLAVTVTNFLGVLATDASEAIQWFNSLPGPIQDVGLAAAVVLAASGPLLTGLGALSLSVIGIQSIPEVLARIAASIGLSGAAAEVATPPTAAFAAAEAETGVAGAAASPGVDRLAASEVVAGETAAATGTELTGLAAVVVTVAEAAGVAAVAWGAWKLDQWWTENEGVKGGIDLLGASVDAAGAAAVSAADKFANWALGAWASTNVSQATGAIALMDAALAKLVNDIPGVSTVLDTWANNLSNLIAFQEDSLPLIDKQTASERLYEQATANAATGTRDFAGAINTADPGVAALSDKITKLAGALSAAQTTLAIVRENQDGSTQSAQMLAAAQENVTQATNALNSALGEHKTKVDAASASWKVLSQEQAADYIAMSTAANSYAGQVTAAVDKILDAQAKTSDQLNADVGAWLQLATTAGTSAGAVAQAYQAIQAELKRTGDDYTALGADITQAMQQQGITLDSLETRYAALASSGTATSEQLQAAWKLVQTAAGATGVSTQQLADDLNALAACGYTVSAAMVNGQLQINGLKVSADGASASVKGLIQSTTDAATGITIYKSHFDEATVSANAHTAAAHGAAVAIQTVGQAAGSATPYVSQFSQAQMQGGTYAESAAHSFDNAGISLTQYGTVAGEAYQYTTQLTTGTQTLTTNQEALYQAAIASGDAIQTASVQQTDANGVMTQASVTIQGVTNDLSNFDDATGTAATDSNYATSAIVTDWNNVTAAINQATGAADSFGGAGSASGSSKGQDFAFPMENTANSAFNTAATQWWENQGQIMLAQGLIGGFLSFGEFGNAAQTGGGLSTPISYSNTSTAMVQVAHALDTTTTSTNALTDALTGHSLAPALDTTAQSTDVLSNHLKTVTAGFDTFGVTISTVNGVLGVQEGAGTPVSTAVGILAGSLGNLGDTVTSVQEMLDLLNDQANQNAIPGLGDLTASVSTLANEALVASTAVRSQTASIVSQQTATPSGTQVGADQVDTPMGDWYLSNGVWTLHPAIYAVQGDLGSAATALASQTAGLPAGQSTSTPSGTQVAPGVIDSAQGQWTQGGDGVWTLHPITSGTALQSASQAGDAAASATANAAGSGLTSLPSGGTEITPTQYQFGDGTYYQVGGKWYLFSQTTLGTGGYFGNGGGASAAFGSGSNGSPSVAPNVTFNISGVTPSAANALMNQAIGALRLGARQNL